MNYETKKSVIYTNIVKVQFMVKIAKVKNGYSP